MRAGLGRGLACVALACSFSFSIIGPALAATPEEIGPGHLRLSVPGRPFGVAFSQDGAALFVALAGEGAEGAALAVFSIVDGVPALQHRVPLDGGAGAIALSHDGRWLAVAQQDAGVGVYDVAQLIAGASTPRIALLATGPGRDARRGSGTLGVGFSNDDTLLLATDEWQARVSVFEFARLLDPSTRASALRGAVPTGLAPVGIAFTADGTLALVTSEVGPGRALASDCTGPAGGRRPPGIVVAIDLARAASTPADAVVGAVSAGCEAVRIVRAGPLVYVSARGDDEVLVLDPTRFANSIDGMVSASNAARVARIAVGAQPVGIGIAGRWLIVADSHRRSGGPSEISIVERATMRVVATVPAAAFAREVAVSPDGRHVVVGAYLGRAVELIELDRLGLPP